ncbi:MAG: dTMP kinase [Patescibacteria group bacterium]
MFICFSGIDGCGKGTQKEFLADYYRGLGNRVFLSKAYGDAEKECFSAFIERWSQEAILFLFQALHTEQRKKAEQALQRGEIVIADRWDESYLAYHEAFGILSMYPALRARLNEIAFASMAPDVTFLIDLSEESARKRLQSRGMDFFDRLSADYHRTMRRKYLELAKERNWIVIDGAKTPADIRADVIAHLPSC